jgi:hypothetical protein
VTTSPRSGRSGTWARTSSSSESSPSSASRLTAKAVNCFAVEPMLERVSTVSGTPWLRSAILYARWKTISPPRTNATSVPGSSGSAYSAMIRSTCSPMGAASWAATQRPGAWMPAPARGREPTHSVRQGRGTPHDPRRAREPADAARCYGNRSSRTTWMGDSSLPAPHRSTANHNVWFQGRPPCAGRATRPHRCPPRSVAGGRRSLPPCPFFP